MSSFPILDLVIGMIFIYFLFSIISSSVVEMILTFVDARAKLLEEWLCTIFSKEMSINGKKIKLGQQIMDHCSITALSGQGKSPSYIDAKNFTSALLEKITFDPNDPKSIATELNTLITKIQNTDALSTELQRVFLTYAYDARDSYQAVSNKTVSAVDMFRSKIEDWYNSSMDRLGGNLKRKYARPFTFWVTVITVLLLNADSVSIAKYLYSNPDARARVVAQAYNASYDTLSIFNAKAISTVADKNVVSELNQTLHNTLDSINIAKGALDEDIPLGWSNESQKGNVILYILLKISGLLCTVFAIMLGPPFCFDLLNKVVNLRGTGNKPAVNPESSGSTDSSSTAPVTVLINSKTDEEAVG